MPRRSPGAAGERKGDLHRHHPGPRRSFHQNDHRRNGVATWRSISRALPRDRERPAARDLSRRRSGHGHDGDRDDVSPTAGNYEPDREAGDRRRVAARDRCSVASIAATMTHGELALPYCGARSRRRRGAGFAVAPRSRAPRAATSGGAYPPGSDTVRSTSGARLSPAKKSGNAGTIARRDLGCCRLAPVEAVESGGTGGAVCGRPRRQGVSRNDPSPGNVDRARVDRRHARRPQSAREFGSARPWGPVPGFESRPGGSAGSVCRRGGARRRTVRVRRRVRRRR